MRTPITEVPHAAQLAERINRIEPSATMAAVAEADKTAPAGNRRSRRCSGEPHFTTPQHIKDAAIAAINGNFTNYTAVGGTARIEGRDHQASRYRFWFCVQARGSIASVGGKHALFNVISVLVDHGDEVILPVPYWVSFKDMVNYAGGTWCCSMLTSRRIFE